MREFWLLASIIGVLDAVARFEPVSVSDTSLIIRMIRAENVSSFDMIVYIYDLDRQVEFRKTELKGSRKDQLFSFDSLQPNTWFVFRIYYRLLLGKVASSSANPQYTELKTKQELILKTKASSKENPERVNDRVAYIDEAFLGSGDVYISVKPEFDPKTIITVVVPEMRCGRSVIKPLAQQVTHNTRIHFNVTELRMRTSDCTQVCIFPFLRLSIKNGMSETFRGKEWCGTLQDAYKQGVSTADDPKISMLFILLSLMYCLVR